MKKMLFALFTAFLGIACTETSSLVVTIKNPLNIDRTSEMVELSMDEISQLLHLSDTEQLILFDMQGNELPYQITYDSKLIFPVSLLASDSITVTLAQGVPTPIEVTTCGRQYSERLDDLAWENDRIAFRTYGPAIQVRGDRLFGYDIFTKSVKDPVMEERYDKDINHGISYHVDHGNGMDCYGVGANLGAGTTALFPNNTLIYPYSYVTCEILDNGPLRFTAYLIYQPTIVGSDSLVTETRIITLDKGSQLNKTVVTYENLSQKMPLATGIVLQQENPKGYDFDVKKGYISYADLTEDPKNGNGTIYVGAVFPKSPDLAAPFFFSEEELSQQGGAYGHLLAVSEYTPNSEYLYYWGSGWSKYGFPEERLWINYLELFAQQIRTPLEVRIN